jgi:threonine dehydrogenase-like Zn-dependent dehydrogenase
VWSAALGATRVVDPAETAAFDEIRERADVAFELSGAPAALDTAIAATGFGGRVVIGSWYGAKPVTVDLGGRFHRSRIQLIASQVSTLTPSLAARWDKRRRLDVAWRMLADIRPSRLITHRLAFNDIAEGYRLLDQDPGSALQVVVRY